MQVRRASRQIALHATGHHAIDHQPVTEALVGDAQHFFAQMAALRMHHGKGCVVADGADVAEVVRESFELRHERTQPNRALRYFDRMRGFDRPGKGNRVGHGAVAGNAPGQHRRPMHRHSRHQALRPLVHVTESRLEAHDGFAVRREPEVTGLDDARVYRTHRDLMQALTDCGEEDVRLGDARLVTLGAERARTFPRPVIEPRTLVGEPFRFHSPQVANGPLQANGGRMQLADRWKASSVALETHHAEVVMILAGQRHMHVFAIRPRVQASSACRPQADSSCAARFRA